MIRIKSKILVLLLSVLIVLGCKEPKQQENKSIVELSNVDFKVKDSIKALEKVNNNNSIERECFKKIGVKKSKDYDVDVIDFKEFSIEATGEEDEITTDLVLIKNKKATTYETDIILDMGEINYWAFVSSEKNHIYLLELDNYYSSTFFILVDKNNELYSVGNISTDEPKVEIEGVKNKSFKFCLFGDKLIAESFLDKELQEKKEFKISSEKRVKKKKNTFRINTTVYAQVETYLNVRSAPNSNGEIIAKAYPKDGLKILEVLDGWVKIELNGTEGYVSKDFVK
jgi:uncharacterized protein YgiM (DUF1202 family)